MALRAASADSSLDVRSRSGHGKSRSDKGDDAYNKGYNEGFMRGYKDAVEQVRDKHMTDISSNLAELVRRRANLALFAANPSQTNPASGTKSGGGLDPETAPHKDFVL